MRRKTTRRRDRALHLEVRRHLADDAVLDLELVKLLVIIPEIFESAKLEPAFQISDDLFSRPVVVRVQDLCSDLWPVEQIVSPVLRGQLHVRFEVVACVVGTTYRLVALLAILLQWTLEFACCFRLVLAHVAFEMLAAKKTTFTRSAIHDHVTAMLFAVLLGWNGQEARLTL